MFSSQYVIITPARNEGRHIAQTVQSVASQTIRPLKWVIVNDGSADDTAAIIDKAAGEHSWIAVLHRRDRGSRKQGGGVIEAFYDGHELIKSEPWDFLVKLDGDLSFDRDYFERCFHRFDAEEKLGIGG